MAKKLSDINKEIMESNIRFYEFFMKKTLPSVQDFIKQLESRTEVYLFSGIIRDYFLYKKELDFPIRDIDLVTEDDVDLHNLFPKENFKINSFGGYKLYINNTPIDIWPMKKTWGIKYQSTLFPKLLHADLLRTTFFNFSSILFNFNSKKFIYGKKFLQFMQKKEIALVLPQNPYPELCIINARFYLDNRNLKPSKELIDYIIKNKEHISSFKQIQHNHFGKIIYSDDDMNKWFDELFINKSQLMQKPFNQTAIDKFSSKQDTPALPVLHQEQLPIGESFMPINIYRFKISLIEYHAVPANKLHRILDIAGNATFEDLHDLIFTAFDRYDPHLYQFILTREEAKSDHALYDCKERVLDPYSMEDADMMMDEGDIAHNAATFTLDDAKLQEKDFIYYRFDFGDDWMHRLCLEKIYPLEAAAIGDEPYAVIVKKVGESPAQYEDEDDEEDDT